MKTNYPKKSNNFLKKESRRSEKGADLVWSTPFDVCEKVAQD